MARKLRITVSVFFGVAAVALGLLWMRSACHADWVWGEIYPSTHFQIGSQHGNLWVLYEHRPGVLSNYKQNNSSPYFWTVKSSSVDCYWRGSFEMQKDEIAIPHWFLVLTAAVIALLPWIKRRFSLRSLLVATTLLAVVLGLAGWATR